MYLFDTDVLSVLAKRHPPESLVAKLARTPRVAQFTSAVNAAEIYAGIFRMGGIENVGGAPGGAGQIRRDTPQLRLLRYIEEQIFARLTILPFDRECARVYGRLRAALERRGRPRFEPDLQIASIALYHGLIVVTGNVRHFGGIPRLRIENWLV